MGRYFQPCSSHGGLGTSCRGRKQVNSISKSTVASAGLLLLRRVEKWDVKAVLDGVLVVLSSKNVEELCILHGTTSKALSPPIQGQSVL